MASIEVSVNVNPPAQVTASDIAPAIDLGAFYPSSNPSGYTSGSTDVAQTGALTGVFYPLNSNPSNYVTSGQTGNFGAAQTGILTGVFYPLATNPSNYVVAGNTGAFVTTGQTGIFTGIFYPLLSNPLNYVTSGQTGVFVTSGGTGSFVTIGQTGVLTGAFYPLASNPLNYVTTLQTGAFAPSGGTGLFVTTTQTGTLTGAFYPLSSNPSNYITTAQTGAFAPAAGTGSFITTGQTGVFALSAGTGSFITTGQTGVFYSTSNPSNYVSSGSTGSFVTTGNTGNFITTGQTGVFVTTASTGSFVTTGQTGVFALAAGTGSFITSGQTGIFALAANTGAFVTTGQTGVFQAALGFTPLNKVGDSSTGTYTLGRLIATNYSALIKTITGQYTLTSTDSTILFSGNNLTGTLPSASTVSGLYFNVKNVFGTVVLSGAQSIDGVSGISLLLNKAARIQSDGAVWWIVNEQATGTLTGAFYPLVNNPSNYVSTSQTGAFAPTAGTGNFITTGQTGAFAPSAGTGNFITTGQTGVFALAAGTGNFITTGQTGAFAPAANTGNFITTGQTGAFAPAAGTGTFITTGQTGVFQAALGFVPLNKVGDTSTGNFTFGNIFANNYGEGVKTVTGQYTIVSIDGIILFSGSNLTGTLPSASTVSGYDFIVKNIFGTTVLSGTQAIDGVSGINLPLNKAATIVSNGSLWYVINEQATGVLTGVFAQSSQTGSFVTTNQTGTFINSGQTGIFVITGNTGVFITTGQTGAFYAATNPNNHAVVQVTGGSAITGANFTGIGAITVTYSNGLINVSGSSSAGEANTASNLGAGSGIFAQKSVVDLQFKSLKSASGLGLVGSATDLTFYVTGDYTLNSQTGILQTALGFTPLNKVGDSSTGNYTFGQITATSYKNAIKTVTGQYTFTSSDSTVLFSGSNLTGTLPSASTVSGLSYFIKNINGSLIISGTQAIDGASGWIVLLNEGVEVTSDGTVWWITNDVPTGTLTGAFAQSSQTGSFVTTSQTGSFITTGQTGVYLTGVNNLGAGSGIYSSTSNNAAQLRSLVTGSGIKILGDANTLTVHTLFGNQFNSGLQANITLAAANSFSGILSGDIGPGTWLVMCGATIRSTGNSAMKITAKVWSGVGAFFSSEGAAAAMGANLTGFVNLDLGGLLVNNLASMPLVLSIASTFAGAVVLPVPQDNSAGITNGTSTFLQAVRII